MLLRIRGHATSANTKNLVVTKNRTPLFLTLIFLCTVTHKWRSTKGFGATYRRLIIVALLQIVVMMQKNC